MVNKEGKTMRRGGWEVDRGVRRIGLDVKIARRVAY
jgi:hypothetical protein